MLFFLNVAEAPLWLAFLLACGVSMLIPRLRVQGHRRRPAVEARRHPAGHRDAGLVHRIKSAVKAGYSAEAHPFPASCPTGCCPLGNDSRLLRRRRHAGDRRADRRRLQMFLNRTPDRAAMQAVAAEHRVGQGAGHQRQADGAVRVPDQRDARRRRGAGSPRRTSPSSTWATRSAEAFYAAIIGGFNQTRGALLGGVLVGVLENLMGAYFSPRTRKASR